MANLEDHSEFDALFNKKVDDFNYQPSEKVWNGVNQQVTDVLLKSAAKKVLFFKSLAAGLGALLIGVVSFYEFENSEEQIKKGAQHNNGIASFETAISPEIDSDPIIESSDTPRNRESDILEFSNAADNESDINKNKDEILQTQKELQTKSLAKVNGGADDAQRKTNPNYGSEDRVKQNASIIKSSKQVVRNKITHGSLIESNHEIKLLLPINLSNSGLKINANSLALAANPFPIPEQNTDFKQRINIHDFYVQSNLGFGRNGMASLDRSSIRELNDIPVLEFNEYNLSSPGIGISAGMGIGNRIVVEAGIEWSRIVQNIEINRLLNDVDMEFLWSEYNYFEDDVEFNEENWMAYENAFCIGQGSLGEFELPCEYWEITDQLYVTQSLDYINIPLRLGYILVDKKSKLTVYGGLNFQKINRFGNLEFDWNILGDTPYEFSTDHLKPWLLGINSSVQYELTLNKHFSVPLSAYFNGSFQNIYKMHNAGIKPLNYGIKSGVKYQF